MVFDKVRAIICEEMEIDDEKLVTMDTDLVEDLDLDSLGSADIIMSLEDEFHIEVPDEAVDTIKTVGDIVRYVEEHT